MTDAEWLASGERIAEEDADEMIGSYAAHLARAIQCLPPSKRDQGFATALQLIAADLGIECTVR